MGTLSLRRSHLVITHLLNDRRPELLALRSGPAHIAALEALAGQVDAALAGRAVRARDPVRGLVREHIAVIAALAKLLDGERSNPLGEPEVRAAAAFVYAEVVAGRLGPAHPAIARTDYADATRRLLPALAGALRRLPATVRALIERWIAVGEAIQAALVARQMPPSDDALGLVRQVMRALGRLRRAVRLEAEIWGELPAGAEVRLLGFADLLQRRPRSALGASIKSPADGGAVSAPDGDVRVDDAAADVEPPAVGEVADGGVEDRADGLEDGLGLDTGLGLDDGPGEPVRARTPTAFRFSPGGVWGIGSWPSIQRRVSGAWPRRRRPRASSGDPSRRGGPG